VKKKRYDFIESLSNTTNRNEASELVKTNVKLTKLCNNGSSRMTVGWSIHAKLSANNDVTAKKETRIHTIYETDLRNVTTFNEKLFYIEKDGARTALFLNFCFVLCIVCFLSFCVLFLCKCVLYYCHRLETQLQLNMSYHIIIIPNPSGILPEMVRDCQRCIIQKKLHSKITRFPRKVCDTG
jgi:hypothetical protein